MDNDYRCSKYCAKFDSSKIKEGKNNLRQIILSDYPEQENMHKYVSKNDGKYKVLFMEIYNNKCAYCGVQLGIIPKTMFQIDHVVYKKSDTYNGDIEAAGHMDNLVLACQSCNNKKRDFFISEDIKDSLHPDDPNMKNSFTRDALYYIRVSEKEQNNENIKAFYEKLKLNRQIHRLDYLLLNMIGLNKKLKDDRLAAAINKLMFKRNSMG